MLLPQNVKAIFHCNAKPLALGPRVGLDPQRDDFALGIRTCWYLKTLADPTQSLTDPKRSLARPMQAGGILVALGPWR